MTRTDPFPGLAPDQPVGPMGNRRHMEFMNDVTLQGMARGCAGEPEYLVTLALAILAERRRRACPEVYIPTVNGSLTRDPSV